MSSPPFQAGVPFQVDYYPEDSAGHSYDPQPAGGAVNDLFVYSDPARTVQVAHVSGSTRIAAGQYRFPAITLNVAQQYYSTVLWSATNTGPVVTDSTDSFPVLALGGTFGWTDLCSVADVRSLNLSSTPPTDTTIATAISMASPRVRAYCGQDFPPATVRSVTISDVRNALISLAMYDPFTNITSITNESGYSYDLTRAQISEKERTIRLYGAIRDVDGFVIPYTERMLPQLNGRYPYGTDLTITGTFGWTALPAPVVIGTALLAKDDLGYFDGSTPSLDPRVEGFKVEGYSVTFMPKNSSFRSPGRPGAGVAPPDEDTTGNLAVDRMLYPFKRKRFLVG